MLSAGALVGAACSWLSVTAVVVVVAVTVLLSEAAAAAAGGVSASFAATTAKAAASSAFRLARGDTVLHVSGTGRTPCGDTGGEIGIVARSSSGVSGGLTLRGNMDDEVRDGRSTRLGVVGTLLPGRSIEACDAEMMRCFSCSICSSRC